MNNYEKRQRKVIIPVLNSVLRLGLIDSSEPWLPISPLPPVSFNDMIEGDIPVAIEVGPWKHGLRNIWFALWPVSKEVSFEECQFNCKWLGDVWGRLSVDRRIDLRLAGVRQFHCRVARQARIDEIANYPLDDRMPESF